MPQCGHVREAEQTSLWCVRAGGERVWQLESELVCVDIQVSVAVACSCANTAPCHPCRRKKNLNGRSWKKSWRRITARSRRLRPSWYALLRQQKSCCCWPLSPSVWPLWLVHNLGLMPWFCPKRVWELKLVQFNLTEDNDRALFYFSNFTFLLIQNVPITSCDIYCCSWSAGRETYTKICPPLIETSGLSPHHNVTH